MRKKLLIKNLITGSCLAATLFLVASCGDGGGGTAATNSDGEVISGVTTGYDVPSEISAVSASTSSSAKPALGVNAKSTLVGVGATFVGAATDSGTDYSNAESRKFVEERTLEQFDIIEQVLNAVAQTHYADPDNINNGPYKTMVAWEEEQNGVDVKQLQPWVIDSRMIVENGQDVNRVLAWIESFEDGEPELIKAEFKIYQSATQNSDGSFADYGVWKLNVKFGDSANDFFVASADIENGVSVVKYKDSFPEGDTVVEDKAILYKSASTGYGKVQFMDWESVDWETCGSDDSCSPEPATAVYAYDGNYVAIKKGSEATRYVDRSSTTEMTHRYGVFDGETGSDVQKTKTWGFPVTFTLDGVRQFGYYGAWQGRHELWGGAQGSIPEGTTVTRQDRSADQSNETYTVSAPFKGTLVKRTTTAASLDDIKNIPVETWINEFYNLVFDSSTDKWYNCKNPTWDQNGMSCESEEDFTDLLPTLSVSANDNQKFVNINRWDNDSQTNVEYVYLTSGPSGAGFYEATFDQSTGKYSSTGTKYTPADQEQLWANIGGSIYIMYDGSSWVEKTIASFDTRTWTPKFDDSADKPYTLPLNVELYINNQGANYIVKRTAASTYDVKVEIQSVANPVNASTFVASGTVFKSPWNPDNDSTFEFDMDPDSSTYMKLVYKTIGDNDRDSQGEPNTGVAVGAEVKRGIWGMEAYVSDAATGTQFNWDYPRDGENWGTVTYLLDSNGDYVLVDDPIRFASVTLTNGKGESKTLSLQFDGWMHGLPRMYEELRKNSFNMSQDISDKIINIPAGTEVTDANDSSKSYLLKPLETSIFLDVVTDTTGLDLPDISDAQALDLSDIPDLEDPGLGDTPTTSGVKYSEGKLLE